MRTSDLLLAVISSALIITGCACLELSLSSDDADFWNNLFDDDASFRDFFGDLDSVDYDLQDLNTTYDSSSDVFKDLIDNDDNDNDEDDENTGFQGVNDTIHEGSQILHESDTISRRIKESFVGSSSSSLETLKDDDDDDELYRTVFESLEPRVNKTGMGDGNIVRPSENLPKPLKDAHTVWTPDGDMENLLKPVNFVTVKISLLNKKESSTPTSSFVPTPQTVVTTDDERVNNDLVNLTTKEPHAQTPAAPHDGTKTNNKTESSTTILTTEHPIPKDTGTKGDTPDKQFGSSTHTQHLAPTPLASNPTGPLSEQMSPRGSDATRMSDVATTTEHSKSDKLIPSPQTTSNYATAKSNVDMLKPTTMGLSRIMTKAKLSRNRNVSTKPNSSTNSFMPEHSKTTNSKNQPRATIKELQSRINHLTTKLSIPGWERQIKFTTHTKHHPTNKADNEKKLSTETTTTKGGDLSPDKITNKDSLTTNPSGKGKNPGPIMSIKERPTITTRDDSIPRKTNENNTRSIPTTETATQSTTVAETPHSHRETSAEEIEEDQTEMDTQQKESYNTHTTDFQTTVERNKKDVYISTANRVIEIQKTTAGSVEDLEVPVATDTKKSHTTITTNTEAAHTNKATNIKGPNTPIATNPKDAHTTIATKTDAPSTTIATNTKAAHTTIATNTEDHQTTIATNTEDHQTTIATNTESPATTIATNTEDPQTTTATNTEAAHTTMATNTESPPTTTATNTEAAHTTMATNTEAVHTSIAINTEAPPTTMANTMKSQVITASNFTEPQIIIDINTNKPQTIREVDIKNAQTIRAMDTIEPSTQLETNTTEFQRIVTASTRGLENFELTTSKYSQAFTTSDAEDHPSVSETFTASAETKASIYFDPSQAATETHTKNLQTNLKTNSTKKNHTTASVLSVGPQTNLPTNYRNKQTDVPMDTTELRANTAKNTKEPNRVTSTNLKKLATAIEIAPEKYQTSTETPYRNMQTIESTYPPVSHILRATKNRQLRKTSSADSPTSSKDSTTSSLGSTTMATDPRHHQRKTVTDAKDLKTTTVTNTTEHETTTVTNTTEPRITTVTNTTEHETTTVTNTTAHKTTTVTNTTEPRTTIIADTTAPKTNNVTDIKEPKTSTITDTTQPNTNTVADSTELRTNSGTDTTEPKTNTVSSTTELSKNTATDTKQPMTNTVTDTKEPNATTVTYITQANTTTVLDSREPNTNTVTDTTELSKNIATDTTEPESTTVSDNTEPKTNTITDTTASRTNTLTDNSEPKTKTVTDTTVPESTTVSDNTEPKTNTVKDTTEPNAITVTDITQANTTTVLDSREPNTNTVTDTTELSKNTATDTTKPKTNTVTDTTEPKTTTVTDTAEPKTTTVKDTTEPKTTTVPDTTERKTNTVTKRPNVITDTKELETNRIIETREPKTTTVTDNTELRASTVTDTTESETTTVSDSTGPKTTTVSDSTGPKTTTVSDSTGPKTKTVTDTTEPETTTIADSTERKANTITDTTEPETTTVTDTTEPRTHTITDTTVPETTTVTDITQPNTNTVTDITELRKNTFTDTTKPKEKTVTDTTEPDTTTFSDSTKRKTTTITHTLQPNTNTVTESTKLRTNTVTYTREPKTNNVTETAEPKNGKGAYTTEAKTIKVSDTTQPKINAIADITDLRANRVADTAEPKTTTVTETIEPKTTLITDNLETKTYSVTSTTEPKSNTFTKRTNMVTDTKELETTTLSKETNIGKEQTNTVTHTEEFKTHTLTDTTEPKTTTITKQTNTVTEEKNTVTDTKELQANTVTDIAEPTTHTVTKQMNTDTNQTSKVAEQTKTVRDNKELQASTVTEQTNTVTSGKELITNTVTDTKEHQKATAIDNEASRTSGARDPEEDQKTTVKEITTTKTAAPINTNEYHTGTVRNSTESEKNTFEDSTTSQRPTGSDTVNPQETPTTTSEQPKTSTATNTRETPINPVIDTKNQQTSTVRDMSSFVESKNIQTITATSSKQFQPSESATDVKKQWTRTTVNTEMPQNQTNRADNSSKNETNRADNTSRNKTTTFATFKGNQNPTVTVHTDPVTTWTQDIIREMQLTAVTDERLATPTNSSTFQPHIQAIETSTVAATEPQTTASSDYFNIPQTFTTNIRKVPVEALVTDNKQPETTLATGANEHQIDLTQDNKVLQATELHDTESRQTTTVSNMEEVQKAEFDTPPITTDNNNKFKTTISDNHKELRPGVTRGSKMQVTSKTNTVSEHQSTKENYELISATASFRNKDTTLSTTTKISPRTTDSDTKDSDDIAVENKHERGNISVFDTNENTTNTFKTSKYYDSTTVASIQSRISTESHEQEVQKSVHSDTTVPNEAATFTANELTKLVSVEEKFDANNVTNDNETWSVTTNIVKQDLSTTANNRKEPRTSASPYASVSPTAARTDDERIGMPTSTRKSNTTNRPGKKRSDSISTTDSNTYHTSTALNSKEHVFISPSELKEADKSTKLLNKADGHTYTLELDKRGIYSKLSTTTPATLASFSPHQSYQSTTVNVIETTPTPHAVTEDSRTNRTPNVQGLQTNLFHSYKYATTRTIDTRNDTTESMTPVTNNAQTPVTFNTNTITTAVTVNTEVPKTTTTGAMESQMPIIAKSIGAPTPSTGEPNESSDLQAIKGNTTPEISEILRSGVTLSTILQQNATLNKTPGTSSPTTEKESHFFSSFNPLVFDNFKDNGDTSRDRQVLVSRANRIPASFMPQQQGFFKDTTTLHNHASPSSFDDQKSKSVEDILSHSFREGTPQSKLHVSSIKDIFRQEYISDIPVFLSTVLNTDLKSPMVQSKDSQTPQAITAYGDSRGSGSSMTNSIQPTAISNTVSNSESPSITSLSLSQSTQPVSTVRAQEKSRAAFTELVPTLSSDIAETSKGLTQSAVVSVTDDDLGRQNTESNTVDLNLRRTIPTSSVLIEGNINKEINDLPKSESGSVSAGNIKSTENNRASTDQLYDILRHDKQKKKVNYSPSPVTLSEFLYGMSTVADPDGESNNVHTRMSVQSVSTQPPSTVVTKGLEPTSSLESSVSIPSIISTQEDSAHTTVNPAMDSTLSLAPTSSTSVSAPLLVKTNFKSASSTVPSVPISSTYTAIGLESSSTPASTVSPSLKLTHSPQQERSHPNRFLEADQTTRFSFTRVIPTLLSPTVTPTREERNTLARDSSLAVKHASTTEAPRLHNLDLINLITILGAVVDPSRTLSIDAGCVSGMAGRNSWRSLIATLKDLEASEMLSDSLRHKFETCIKMSDLNPLLWGKVFSLASQYQCLKEFQTRQLRAPPGVQFPGLSGSTNPKPSVNGVDSPWAGPMPAPNTGNQLQPSLGLRYPQDSLPFILQDPYLRGYLASKARFLQQQRGRPLYPAENQNMSPYLGNYYFIDGPVTFNNAGNVNNSPQDGVGQ